jgi:hypothetical protein
MRVSVKNKERLRKIGQLNNPLFRLSNLEISGLKQYNRVKFDTTVHKFCRAIIDNRRTINKKYVYTGFAMEEPFNVISLPSPYFPLHSFAVVDYDVDYSFTLDGKRVDSREFRPNMDLVIMMNDFIMPDAAMTCSTKPLYEDKETKVRILLQRFEEYSVSDGEIRKYSVYKQLLAWSNQDD